MTLVRPRSSQYSILVLLVQQYRSRREAGVITFGSKWRLADGTAARQCEGTTFGSRFPFGHGHSAADSRGTARFFSPHTSSTYACVSLPAPGGHKRWVALSSSQCLKRVAGRDPRVPLSSVTKSRWLHGESSVRSHRTIPSNRGHLVNEDAVVDLQYPDPHVHGRLVRAWRELRAGG